MFTQNALVITKYVSIMPIIIITQDELVSSSYQKNKNRFRPLLAMDLVEVAAEVAQVPDTINFITAQECGSMQPSPSPHQTVRCACGCVPNILSLFEMAELRAAARKRQAKP